MEVKVWDEKEQFLFPKSFGVPKEVKKVEVTPQFEHKVTEESIQIVGIYHITCHVEFEEGEHAHHATSEFTQIEDLDVQGEVGYFEYAVPMSVEIAKDKVQPGSSPTLNVKHVNSNTTEHASIEIAWLVRCEYEGPKENKPESVQKPEPSVNTKGSKEVEQIESSVLVESELQFILNLDDGMSKLTFPSNYIPVKQKAEQ
ncbi:hypothetical protein PB01_12490 [Psychrobacillus glaciei]|uniref:DUF3794 domain-containing protein n=1 Tax=Psychrobacillus glaciei TaxID=2283160 RepID=A0A5J6SPZ3_9BACI|nr:hypothetical protein [Psychrobacillus glaciei]QFF99583.1 hypothetical protein PB01_12490 [Psychrobacillus glaciei]